MKKKEANVRIRSLIQHPDAPPTIEQQRLNATWIQKGQTDYIQYEETKDDMTIRTNVKITDDDILILRGGDIEMRLPLRHGQVQIGTYRNDPLHWKLRVVTDDLQIERNDTKGRLHADYTLSLGEQLLGTYALTITYTEGTL